MIGKTITHYKILEKLGEGGMGVVYKAHDTKLDRDVALKFLPSQLTRSDTDKARFLQEAKAAAALNHNNVCTIHEIHDEGENPFIVMEYVEGDTLRARIKDQGSRIKQTIDIAVQIAEALKAAHKKNIVHRDVKSENIMVTETGQVKVMDFGLAKLRGSVKLTKSSSTLGTMAYMSPEHLQGKDVDGRTDIFSFGVVLYEMLAGRLPFKGEYDSAMMYSILNEEPEPIQKHRPDLSSELLHVLNRALEKDPEERYQTVNDMLIDLKRIKKSTETVSRPVPASPVPEAKSKQSWMKRLAIPVGVAAVLILVFILIQPLLFEDVLGSAPVPISVISFDNQTGDAAFDRLEKVIPNLLITSLEQSKYLQVTTWQRMRDLLRQMGKTDIETIDEDLGFELCLKDGVDALVLGSVTKLGNVFVTDIKVLDVHTKELLTSVQSQGEGEESIIRTQIDELSKAIAKGVGLSERRIAQAHRSIMDVTTTSMDAYNSYLLGKLAFDKFYLEDARQHLEKAVTLDTSFAEAYLYLSWVYNLWGAMDESIIAFQNAKRFSINATEKERLYVEAVYAQTFERDSEKQIRILTRMGQQYPKEKRVFVDLGTVYDARGEIENAIDAYMHVLDLDPNHGEVLNALAYLYVGIGDFDNALFYVDKYGSAFPGDANPLDSKAEIYMQMGRLDEAIITYRQALERRPDLGSDWTLSYIYALKEDYDTSMQWNQQFIHNAPSIGRRLWGEYFGSLYYLWIGMYEKALQDIKAAEKKAKALGDTFQQMLARYYFIWFYFVTDNPALLVNNLEPLMDYISDNYLRPDGLDLSEYQLLMGFLEIKRGDVKAASSRLDQWKNIRQKNAYISIVIQYHHDLLHMEVLLAQGKIDEAIRVGQKISPPPLPRIGSNLLTDHCIPIRKDGLARAYYAKGNLDRAIAEYECLTTFDPDDRSKFLIDPKDHYRLARLYEEKGNAPGAIEEYEKFLDIWKNADADLPEPHDAGARLARLKGE
ncbi:protein kinase [bacterium]